MSYTLMLTIFLGAALSILLCFPSAWMPLLSPPTYRLGTTEYRGHNYIVLSNSVRAAWRIDGPFVHDPDCPCHTAP